jgi:N-ethylmaleimide reductase
MTAASDHSDSGADLFAPVQLGPYRLANRIVMAPLTRARADADGVPGALMAEYYAQRASAGLIIAEATVVAPQGRGYAFTPGLHSPAQVAGWRGVTGAVHARGGRIFDQLWHVGRISHVKLQPGGAPPVAPSAIVAKASAFTDAGFEPCSMPRALETAEIPAIVADFRRAAGHALEAGFDGVEIHAANGYLIEQFLRDSTNRRSDAYGGERENRARFLLEVVEAVVAAVGGDRVGIRLSPLSPSNDAGADSDPEATYGYVIERLNDFGLAYLHLIEGVTQGPREVPGGFDLQRLRRAFRGVTVANNGYDLALARDALRHGRADLICFGRPFIANPDLVERLRKGAPLAIADRKTFYAGGAPGYTDYPAFGAGAAS